MSRTAATGYLLCYVIMVLPLLLILLNSRSTSPKTIPCLKTLSPAQLAMSATLLLNLAGLPPLGGFCLKAARLAILASSAPLVSLVLIISSVATLGFYINITLLTLISPFESAAPSLVKPPYSRRLVIAGTLGALALPAIPLVLF